MSEFRHRRQRMANPPRNGRALWGALKRNLPGYVGRRRRNTHRPLKPPYFVDPEASAKRMWDLLLTFLVLYTTLVVPFRVCFQVEAGGGFAVMETGMDVAFFIDIVFNFITGLQLPSGEVSYNFRVIVTAYLRGWFTVDFFSTLPFESLAKLFGVGNNAHAALLSAKLLRGLKVLRLFKLARIRRLGKVFANLEDAVYTNQSLVSLAKLALTMLFIAHLVACLWYAVGRTDSEESWVVSISLDPAGHADDGDSLQYVRSVYWAIVTMTTIGYGDIVSHNNNERLLNIAVMAVGVSFFGYVIGTISTLVTNLDVAAARYDERMTVVKEYIISRRMPQYIGNKIRHHFEYFYQNRSVFRERRILKRLPSALRNEMIHHVHAKIVSSIKYFVKCPESLISDIVMAMRPFAMLKDEYVYVEREIAAHVFFIIKGKVQLVKIVKRGKEDMRLSTMSVGDHFGELEVYDHDHGNGVRICSAVAKSYCELTFLSRDAIQKISVSWPEVIKHFRETAATYSNTMRRRVDPSVFDPRKPDPRVPVYHKSVDIPDMVIKTSVMNSKVTPSRPARIAPFMPLNVIDTSLSRPQTIAEESSEYGDQQSRMTEKESSVSARSNATPTTDEPQRSNHAWVASPETSEPPSIHAVHPLTRPFTSIAQGRKATLKALPGTPSAKAKIGAKVATFEGLDSLDLNEAQAGEHKHTSKLSEDDISSTPNGDSYHTQEQPPDFHLSTPEQRYAPSTATASVPESIPLSTETPEAIQRHHEKSLALQQLANHMAEQYPVDAPTEGRVSLAGATNESELHDMIVKIRDSPHEQPKRNLKSERVMLRGTYLFHPQEPSIVLWQFFVGIGIVYSIIVVPFRLGYDVDAVGGWYVLEMIIDGFFLVDILLNFRTAYFDEERKLIYEPRALFWRYVKGWFILDLISTVPIDELFQAAVGTSNQTVRLFPTKLLRLFRIARLLKLTRLIKLSRVFGRIRDTVQLSPSTERLFKLLAIMSIFCHWNACVFHGVMMVSESAGYHSWCGDAFFPDDPQIIECAGLVPVADRYIAAVYWAFTTLTTVGYGDVKPSVHSPYELIVVIILVVVNATVFGYIISSVMTLIQNLDPSDREYRVLMTEMKDYLRDSSVSERLCTNVKMHYQHHIACTSLFPEQKVAFYDMNKGLAGAHKCIRFQSWLQLFDKMAPNLRFDVARLVAVETLFSIPLVTVMEDSFKGFVSYALFLMKPVCIQRGETVCRCGSPGIETFFLVEGECDLLNSQTNLGRIIGENSVFEQYALMAQSEELYRTVSTVTAISGKCILYSLTIQDFKALENVSPAVSTYFLSQLASVLVADDMYSLLPHQKTNVHLSLRRGQHFRAVAEQTHGRVKLKDLSRVAMANLYKRRGSEWSPDLLPKQLQILAEKEEACDTTVTSATVNAIANRQSETHNMPDDSNNSMREKRAETSSTDPTIDHHGGSGSNFLYNTTQTITEVSETSERSNSRRTHSVHAV
ncbi:Potassium voltage-gated channel sub H member 4 [Phytophthora pseudosyringae]|uniref:Potassium voltage-gated channel sub H member 4 n=1 Tax=Phytophthora pseudosyringae TaxID=221518 RepID=A0A8T1W4L9_9STRA|nr:Potassium voltage-gated channel sub H member 4 [Phytophthora pseudosyringae]